MEYSSNQITYLFQGISDLNPKDSPTNYRTGLHKDLSSNDIANYLTFGRKYFVPFIYDGKKLPYEKASKMIGITNYEDAILHELFYPNSDAFKSNGMLDIEFICNNLASDDEKLAFFEFKNALKANGHRCFYLMDGLEKAVNSLNSKSVIKLSKYSSDDGKLEYKYDFTEIIRQSRAFAEFAKYKKNLSPELQLNWFNEHMLRPIGLMPANRQSFLLWEEGTNDIIDFKCTYFDMVGDKNFNTALLLSQIVYWYLPDKAGHNNKLRERKLDHFWIVKQRNEWWDETRLTPHQVDKCLEKLEELGLIEKKQMPSKYHAGRNVMHIRLIEDNFYSLWAETISREAVNPYKPNFEDM